MSNQKKPYSVLAYYSFNPIADPLQEVQNHKTFFANRDVTGRIYISEQGINGQMSAAVEDAQAYMDWMHENPYFKEVEFKIHPSDEQVFPRMTVKYRKQLVALDVDLDLSQRGHYLTPKEWKNVLEGEEDYLLIDTRNQYEWKVGHFEGADLPACETFREFPAYVENLKKDHGADKKIIMYCTGGIRCELFSAFLKREGFENVYQLQGGVIKYGLEEGSKHWVGKLFVFDDRLAIPISDEGTAPVGTCVHCGCANDTYYNCANMDCNELFLCCKECSDKFKGCCEESCLSAPRLRPYQPYGSHKPFRKKHLYPPKEI